MLMHIGLSIGTADERVYNVNQIVYMILIRFIKIQMYITVYIIHIKVFTHCSLSVYMLVLLRGEADDAAIRVGLVEGDGNVE